MASLLLWVQWDGAIDDDRWQRLAAVAAGRCRHALHTAEGPGWRALARASRPGEPTPLRRGTTGAGTSTLLLIDRANGRDDPAPDAGPAAWPDARLHDGTPTAAVRLDEAARSVTVFRDLMGQRNLVYARIAGGLIVASGDSVPLAHPAVDAALDEAWLASYYVWLPCAQDETPFRAVRRVAPGETRVLTRERDHATCRRLEPDDSLRSAGDAAIIERFRALLDDSIATACRGAQRVGVSLSAGLDSASVAALAARQPQAPGGRVLGITQGLADWPDIDERTLAAGLARAIGIEHVGYAADALLPWSDPTLRPVCPDVPHQTPFREWKEASYRRFAEAGVDVVLTGNFGDHLFAGADAWAIDALRFRRPWRLLAGIADAIRADGLPALRRNAALRRIVSEPLGRADRIPARVDWLRADLAEALRARLVAERERYRRFPRMRHAEMLLSSDAATDACGEEWFANRHGIEFRSPYRDEALTRFCLSIPADFSFRHGQMKWLLREALRGVLPEDIRLRPKGSDLTPYEIAAEQRQRSIYATITGDEPPLSARVLVQGTHLHASDEERSFLAWFDLAATTWQRAWRDLCRR